MATPNATDADKGRSSPTTFNIEPASVTPGEFLVPTDDLSESQDMAFDNDECIDPNAPLREQDRFLPIANVAKIMKNVVPPSGKISKEAKECVQECVSEFVSFITSEAAERCMQEKRKTINGEDLLFAMSALGFDNYVEPLKLYLQKYREYNRETMQKSKSLDGLDDAVNMDAPHTIHFDAGGSDPGTLASVGHYHHQVVTTSASASSLEKLGMELASAAADEGRSQDGAGGEEEQHHILFSTTPPPPP